MYEYENYHTTGTPSPIEVKALHYKADASNQDEVVAFLRDHTNGHAFQPIRDRINAKRPFKASSYVFPGNMVAVYPDGKFSDMSVVHFHSNFAPLPNGGKYYANDEDEGVVEAYYFAADRSNVDDVLTFLRKYYTPFLTQTERHDDTNTMLKCIAVPYKPGSIAYFYPGRVITLTKRADFPVGSHALEDFQKYYSPYTAPKEADPVPVTRYKKPSVPLGIVTMHYKKDMSNRRDVEDFINAQLNSSRLWRNLTSSAGDRDELIAIHPPYDQTQHLCPGETVGIYPVTLKVICSSPEYFEDNFTTTPPSAKDPLVNSSEDTTSMFPYKQPENETEPASEYTLNRNKVYDALAVLRHNASDLDFEIATKDLMDLLADAYNEGFDFGVEVAQTNPYQSWK